jgi:hypothetical protein
VPHHSILRPDSAALLTLIFALPACSSPPENDDGGGGEASGYCGSLTSGLVSGSGVPKNPATPLSETPVDGSACNAVEREFPLEAGVHVAACTPIDSTTNPPCTGMHYPVWAAFRVYDAAIPRGFWLHDLEHGAVALGYSCTDCADEVDLAVALLDEIGDDPLCTVPARRTLLTPDPRLETSWAAASWGFTLTADCFEPEVFRVFVETHRGHGLEAVCSDGIDVSQPAPL